MSNMPGADGPLLETESRTLDSISYYTAVIVTTILSVLAFASLGTYVAPEGETLFGFACGVLALASFCFGTTFVVLRLNTDYGSKQ